jgi:Flp pilus assembly protein TadG
MSNDSVIAIARPRRGETAAVNTIVSGPPCPRIQAPRPAMASCNRGLAAVEFALLAPALLALIFAIIIYSLYFATYMGVRQATAEAARAAVTGMSTAERSQLASARATTVMAGYGSLMGTNSIPQVTAQQTSTGLFQVTVTYDISGSPLLGYASLLPMPKSTITYQVIVANGSY